MIFSLISATSVLLLKLIFTERPHVHFQPVYHLPASMALYPAMYAYHHSTAGNASLSWLLLSTG